MFSISASSSDSGVAVRPDQRRHPVEPGQLRGAPAALAGDQLVRAAGDRAQQDGLEHAALAQRAGERDQRRLVEAPARLPRVRPDQVDRHLAELGVRRPVLVRRRRRSQDRREPAAHTPAGSAT